MAKKGVVPGKPKKGFYWFFRCLCGFAIRLFYWVKIENEEYLPGDGKVIVCGNHISLMDPVLLLITLRRQISFMAKAGLFKNRLLGGFLLRMGAFPVGGGEQISAIRTAISVLNGGGALGIFPEGTRSRSGKLGDAMNGIGMIVAKTGAPVLPAAILVKGKKPAPFSRTVIRFGRPIDTTCFEDTKEGYAAAAQEAMRRIAEILGDNG